MLKMGNNDSMLILAKSRDEYLNKEIRLVKTIEEAEQLYGSESQLTEAFKEAMSVGNTNEIYLCNVYKYTDYVTVLKCIINQNFTYIVPLFDLLDKFKSINGESYFLAELYSNIILDNTTEIILTEKHGDQYEDIQHFIDTINSKINVFKSKTYEKLVFGTNLCFVANNIKNKKYANVILASLLLQGNSNEYPGNYQGGTVFDLNGNDFNQNECIYFTEAIINGNRKTVPSNLVNFNSERDYYKFIPNNIVRRELLKRIDVSEFKGKSYSNHTKVIIENKIKSIISNAIGELIEDGLLISVDVNVLQNREVELSTRIKIKPFLFSEYISIEEDI